MEALTLLRPLWLWGLLAVPLWILLWRWRSHRADPWRAVCDAELLKAQQVSSGSAMGLRLLWLLSVYVLTIIALAGPSLGREAQPLNQNSDTLIVALDLSEVMRAGDLKPDRLSRARFKLTALLRQRKAGQTALIAYAGEAFTVAPLTDDLSTLDNLLQALDPSVMPIAGQRPERAIRMAQQMLDDAALARARLLLLSSATTEDAERAAAEAQRRGLIVSVLGVGTDHGAPVPVGGGGFLQDSSGGILLPKLDDDALRALADAGGGAYQRISDDESDLQALGVLDPTRTDIGDEVAADQSMTRPRDDGPWLLLLLLPLVAMAARRGVLWSLVLAMPLLSVTPEIQASVWDDLWQRADQQAWQALQADDPARARELAEDPALRGSAAYRAQDFNAAAEEFASGADVDSAYNRGTALAKAQRYEEALSALDEALRRDPSHADAKANRDAVAQWLEQQKQQEKPEQSKSGEGGGQSGEGEPSDGMPEDGEQSESGEPQDGEQQGADPNAGESGEQGQAQDAEGEQSADDQADSSSQESAASEQDFQQEMQQALDAQAPEQDQTQGEEKASEAVSAEQISEAEREQAMQQLLRRVPDDPGGLLRRKFILEYQRRQQEGNER
jgi:Ca-activated chloride channel family protein